jgi:5'-nucleotidase (lipoprotein e(P4) family)
LLNEEYSDSSWVKWTNRVDCDTVPGALSFLLYAKSKGADIFYITNRLESERASTLKDLQRWGFPNATDDHLTMKTVTSGKETRRQKVAAHYEILLLLGDNLSDFSSAFDRKPLEERNAQTRNNAAMFGNKFIVLPNAMYGDWEAAIYEYRNELSPQQKDSIIINGLKKY